MVELSWCTKPGGCAVLVSPSSGGSTEQSPVRPIGLGCNLAHTEHRPNQATSMWPIRCFLIGKMAEPDAQLKTRRYRIQMDRSSTANP